MRRVVVGRRNNGNYGIFCSPPGVDAFTAADSALDFSTSFAGTFGVHASGLWLVPSSGSNNSTTISFAPLPFVPMVVVGLYNSNDGVYYPRQTYMVYSGGGGFYNGSLSIGAHPEYSVTASSITLRVPFGSTGVYVFWKVLRMKGDL